MKKVLYVVLDGMSELDADNSSLREATTPQMDRIARAGEMGFYLPHIGPNQSEPKTDLVVPAFFGMPVDLNPGRAALELFELGEPIQPGSWYFTLKLLDVSQADELDWRRIRPLEPRLRRRVTNGLLRVVAEHCNIIRESEATQHGSRFLIGARSEAACADVVTAARDELRSYGLMPAVADHRQAPTDLATVRLSQQRLLFLGWAKGSLRGAFKYLGALCNPFTRKPAQYFDWDTYQDDFDNWCRPQLANTGDRFDTFVLYTKQTAFEALGIRTVVGRGQSTDGHAG